MVCIKCPESTEKIEADVGIPSRHHIPSDPSHVLVRNPNRQRRRRSPSHDHSNLAWFRATTKPYTRESRDYYSPNGVILSL